MAQIRKNLVRFSVLGAFILLAGCNKLILVPSQGPEMAFWPMTGGNQSRSHFSGSELQLPLTQKWKTRLKLAPGNTFIAVDSTILVASKDGQIHGLNRRTGKKIGAIKMSREDAGTFIYDDGHLLIALNRSRKSLQFKALKNGKKIWQMAAGPIESEPVIENGVGFVANLAGQMIGFDPKTGKKHWSYSGASQIHSSPAVVQQRIIVGTDAGKIISLNSSTGLPDWEFNAGTTIMATPVISESLVFVGNTDSTFWALNVADGSERWRYHTRGKIYHAAAVMDQRVYFGSNDRHLYCLESQTGKLVWKFAAGSVIGTSPLLTPGYVVVGSLDKFIYVLDAKTGAQVWRFETEGRVRTNPIIVDGELFIGSENGDVYCFSPEIPQP